MLIDRVERAYICSFTQKIDTKKYFVLKFLSLLFLDHKTINLFLNFKTKTAAGDVLKS